MSIGNFIRMTGGGEQVYDLVSGCTVGVDSRVTSK